MIYKIRDIEKDREIGFKTINAMEELVFASYDSERVYKIFSNQDDTFKVITTGSYYMTEVAKIKIDELPTFLRVFEKLDCEITNEYGALNDSYIIKAGKKIFRIKDSTCKYMYILPSFNEHELIIYVSNDVGTYVELKEANENA